SRRSRVRLQKTRSLRHPREPTDSGERAFMIDVLLWLDGNVNLLRRRVDFVLWVYGRDGRKDLADELLCEAIERVLHDVCSRVFGETSSSMRRFPACAEPDCLAAVPPQALHLSRTRRRPPIWKPPSS